MDRRHWLTTVGAGGLGLAHCASARADGHKAASTAASDSGSPLGDFHAHFCGIHVAKSNVNFQLLTQHYCSPLGDSMHQCLLFDSAQPARLLGVEYIVSDAIYRSLPDAEKKYWHPHTYEVLAGGLTAPELSATDELAFMKGLLTTWGKTWHTWPDPTTKVPIGEPLLMWSLGADSQVDPKVVADRDARYKISAATIRAARVKAIGFRVPQVDFPSAIDQVGRQWTSKGADEPTPAS
jgi:hypothetical protein